MEKLVTLLQADPHLRRQPGTPAPVPGMDAVDALLSALQALLLPDYFGSGDLYREACRAHYLLRILAPTCPEGALRQFLYTLPQIRQALAQDLQAFLQGDPAVTEPEEVIIAYPGFYAILVQRLAHSLFSMGVSLLPRQMTERSHSRTGIDIHPGARLGKAFFIDHGTGVVIGETAVIGDHVKIYQGVTLGALSTRNAPALRGVKRHPTLEDGVTVYAGASILGGDTVIGTGAVIGANAFVTGSVPPGVTVFGHRPGP